MRYLLPAAFFSFILFPTAFVPEASRTAAQGDVSSQCNFPVILDLAITEFDEMALTLDPLGRSTLYWEIEEALFGPEGEFPMVPLYSQAFISLVAK